MQYVLNAVADTTKCRANTWLMEVIKLANSNFSHLPTKYIRIYNTKRLLNVLCLLHALKICRCFVLQPFSGSTLLQAEIMPYLNMYPAAVVSLQDITKWLSRALKFECQLRANIPGPFHDLHHEVLATRSNVPGLTPFPYLPGNHGELVCCITSQDYV